MKKYILIVIIIFLVIFFIFYYNFFINGNNTIKQSNEEIIENILNENISYTADIEVTVYSNKNENTYEMKQEENETHSYQEVISSGDIEGLVIEEIDNKLILRNTKLNLEKIFENYNELSNNYLFLRTFVKECLENEDGVIYEKDENNLIIELSLNDSNKYIKYKTLYIDKNTGNPTELIIKDSDKQDMVCIKYISIQIFQ